MIVAPQTILLSESSDLHMVTADTGPRSIVDESKKCVAHGCEFEWNLTVPF